ncbi:MAG: preprotein translocase subunit SecA [Candidatus Margulisbacteria bacterium]|nr:preprotein translocase subunit SecA [Candidatus Margulisiibacteriota bacterium]
MFNIVRKIFFGLTAQERIKTYSKTVKLINSLEERYASLSDTDLAAQTGIFRERLKKGETLEAILPEAFAVVRETSKRVLKMRHFDVQLIGGMVLHEGNISEMKTGEGKTLVATLPAYLNALTGKGVFIVTVNDYLARRDSEWMGTIYKFLGLTVGLIQNMMDTEIRKQSYSCDIIYGTNNEFGFDYLRDNMASDLSQCVQRNLHYAIVDEVDSILIDEARTPLIISGVVDENTDKYKEQAIIAKRMKKEEHFTIDEKNKNIVLTEAGMDFAEKAMHIGHLYDIENMDKAHMLVQSLKAIHLFRRDVDYIVKDNEVIIVDEFTGRLMNGRRYSDGLHQAIEAVENLKIQQESQTLATITLQNYFRMFEKLAGMTGTALTEAAEFDKIYGLEVIEIPTNQPIIRTDAADAVYKSRMGKFRAVVKEIAELNKKGRPVLVGTISIEVSELLSKMLKQKNVPHNVLNAKYHEREAEIIAKAGQRGAVTIATNMAGRGTDIVLGEGIAQMGGLCVIGTERHESRRIDNQLRGRCGRQGDPGYTKFYVSLEDELMRLFGSDRIIKIMESLGFDDETPIEHKMISSSIERAQKKVEMYHFNIRKQLLEYDDVMNKQRDIIYKQRRRILEQKQLIEKYDEIIEYQIQFIFNNYYPESIKSRDVDWAELIREIKQLVPAEYDYKKYSERNLILDYILKTAREYFRQYISRFSPSDILTVSRLIYLHTLDMRWIEHLKNMDLLRDGIGLRAYAQKDPLLEYKREGYDMFQDMMNAVEQEVIGSIYKVQIISDEEAEKLAAKQESYKVTSYQAADLSGDQPSQQPVVNTKDKVGRNDLCPCGSGKKYKKCCGNK